MPDRNCFSNLTRQLTDLLRVPCRPPPYDRAVLAMTVLRRFDFVPDPTEVKMVTDSERGNGGKLASDTLDAKLSKAAGQHFHNHSQLDLNERRAIVEYIAPETEKFDNVSTAAERSTALLKERRDARIAAAVTGQNDVRAECSATGGVYAH